MVQEFPQAEVLYQRLKDGVAALIQERLKTASPDQIHLVGIYSGGAWLAERLQKDLQLTSPAALLNTSFYRDDFNKIGLHSQKMPSFIPFDITHQHLILIDDILYTGRSIRAAMSELFDAGRPASIALAVLIDRGGRELPIQPDVVGHRMVLQKNQTIELTQTPEQGFAIAIKEDK